MSTVYFYQMLTEHTPAQCDQDHLDIVISSRASTPDRTAYILGESEDDPFAQMERDAEMLVKYGATILAIPCNTAHYFYDRLARSLPVPILNMVRLTVQHAKAQGCTRLGILATSGTVGSCTYQRMCRTEGIDFAIPSLPRQTQLMNIIYDQIKKGQRADMKIFMEIAAKRRCLAAPSFRSSSGTKGWTTFSSTAPRCWPRKPCWPAARPPSVFKHPEH